jgi:DNA modification methylase
MGEKEPPSATTVNGQNERLVIIHGDCVERMRTLASASIHLVVTSPCYDQLRTYGGHTWDFEATARELFRVLCDGGVVCWNVGDSVVEGSETLTAFKQAIFFKEVCGFRIHDTMIYEKTNPGNPSDRQGRYNQCIEYIFILSKGRPRTFNPIRDKPNATAGVMRFGKKTRRDRKPAAEFGLRGNCWRGNTAAQENCCGEREHPAPMPKWLARDLIRSWSNPGDTVLDPMAGSFTTCVSALELGRKTIGIEIHEPYVQLGREACRNVTPGFEFKESAICPAKVEEQDSPLLIETI